MGCADQPVQSSLVLELLRVSSIKFTPISSINDVMNSAALPKFGSVSFYLVRGFATRLRYILLTHP